MTDPVRSPTTNQRERGGTGDALSKLTPIIALAALVIALFALFQGPGDELQVPTDEEPMLRGFALSADLVNGSNRYHPSTLVAFAGDDIRFSVTNNGEVTHGFTITEFAISDVIPEGESREYTATDVEPGVYVFYCHLHGGHIRGQLVVFDR